MTSRYKYLLSASVISNAILLAVTITLYVILNKKTGKNDFSLEGNNNETFCMTCGTLGQNIQAADTLYDVIHTTEDGRRLCCLRDRREIQTIIEKVHFLNILVQVLYSLLYIVLLYYIKLSIIHCRYPRLSFY